MELFIFARFHALEGREQEVAAALTKQVLVTRAEFWVPRDCGLSFGA